MEEVICHYNVHNLWKLLSMWQKSKKLENRLSQNKLLTMKRNWAKNIEQVDEYCNTNGEVLRNQRVVSNKGTPSNCWEKWLWNNIFLFNRNYKWANLYYYDGWGGGSSNSVISLALVKRLELKIHKHYRPYFVRWLMPSEKCKYNMCQVAFIIG